MKILILICFDLAWNDLLGVLHFRWFLNFIRIADDENYAIKVLDRHGVENYALKLLDGHGSDPFKLTVFKITCYMLFYCTLTFSTFQ